MGFSFNTSFASNCPKDVKLIFDDGDVHCLSEFPDFFNNYKLSSQKIDIDYIRRKQIISIAGNGDQCQNGWGMCTAEVCSTDRLGTISDLEPSYITPKEIDKKAIAWCEKNNNNDKCKCQTLLSAEAPPGALKVKMPKDIFFAHFQNTNNLLNNIEQNKSSSEIISQFDQSSKNQTDQSKVILEAKDKAQQELKIKQEEEAAQLKGQLQQERLLLAEERRKFEDDKIRLSQESNQVKPNIAPNVVVGKRIALVIGNAKYLSSPLRNPINDANDISVALKQSGFEVIDVRDAKLQQMRSAVRSFGDRLINSDVGLVYFSGHGIESKGRNYFIPVDADIQRDDEIADQGLDVSLILEKMTTAGKGVNILIVDACRNDPFSRSFRSTSKGLAAMDAPKGTIIAYSTSPGKVASDGDPKGRNSPYTKHLLSAIQVPNRPIEMVFKEVRRNVQNDTKNDQTPWENTSLSGDFYFRIQN
jgi:hypothetical protein